jgi:hypothetical protein
MRLVYLKAPTVSLIGDLPAARIISWGENCWLANMLRWKHTLPPPSNQTGKAVRGYARYSWSCRLRAASRMSAGNHNQGKDRRGSKSFRWHSYRTSVHERAWAASELENIQYRHHHLRVILRRLIRDVQRYKCQHAYSVRASFQWRPLLTLTTCMASKIWSKRQLEGQAVDRQSGSPHRESL